MLSVNSVSKSIGGNLLNENISFAIPGGKLVCIMGPNGAGKSTLLAMMSGESKPTSGHVTWHGHDIHQTSAQELARQRAVLTQKNQISLGFSVTDIVMMGRLPWAESRETSEIIVHEIIDQLALNHLKNRSIHSLSGGEAQRVALARALCQVHNQEKSYLLLDEPTAALDVSCSHDFLRAVKDRCLHGMTACVVLHDFSLALRYADQVAILDQGRLVTLDAPVEAFSAKIISQVFGVEMNVTVAEDGRHYVSIEPQ